MTDSMLRDWKAMLVCLGLAVLVWWLVQKKPAGPVPPAPLPGAALLELPARARS